VLAESFHLQNTTLVLEFVREGLVKPIFDLGQADRKPDLADLCLIRMSELFPRRPVITVDVDDFRVYR